MTPGRLTVDTATGHVTGPADLHYNDPFPARNGSYGSGAMTGVLMHTMAGDLPGTVSWFNSSRSQASAHFGVSQAGEIWQFGPIGKGWEAWHAAEANATWYGIEFADHGNPANPLTAAQVAAAAQLVECLSSFAGFPLQISDSPSAKGFGWHGMGGQAWGGHLSCPGDVRKAQRGAILALAESIRAGTRPPAQAPAATTAREWTTAGMESLADLSQQEHSSPSEVLRLTAAHGFDAATAAWLDAVFAGQAAAKMPAGLRLWLPG